MTNGTPLQIAEFVSAGEIQDLRAQLPTGYAPLFEQPRG